jgi:alginate O-acetyltransferase complex protein AlgJ
LNEVHSMEPHRKNDWSGRLLLIARSLVALALGLSWMSRSRADDARGVDAFLAAVSAQAARAEKGGQSAIAGSDGWMFFVPELRALSAGPFWGERAAAVSRATSPEYADPLAAIVDFNDQLKKAGIELVVVPVPAKAAVYPEMIAREIKAPTRETARRLDPNHERFYRLLGERGVSVLDLTVRFIEQRQTPGIELYCKTDSHWSGRAIEWAGQAIAQHVHDRPWLKVTKKSRFETEPRKIEIAGDLARMLDESSPAREILAVTFVGTKVGGQLAPIEPARDSPVLLIGDSHTLVFHDPELYARGAGLPDHLALHFGFPVDLVGIRGSAATTTRIELLRRRDNLKGKKLVVWCFSCREFTESSDGWRKVPVIR